MFRLLAFILAFMLIAATAAPPVATASGSGTPVFRDGYYWFAGDPDPYTRTTTWAQVYGWYQGCNRWYWQASYSYAKAVDVADPPTTDDANFETKLAKWTTDVLKAREDVNGKIRLAQERRSALNEAISKIGAGAPATPYSNTFYGYYGGIYAGGYAAGHAAYGSGSITGQTLYGYAQSVNQSGYQYYALDPNVALQQAVRMTDSLNQTVGGVLKSGIDGNSRAEVLRAAAELVRASNPPPKTEQRQTSFNITVGANGQPVVTPVAPPTNGPPTTGGVMPRVLSAQEKASQLAILRVDCAACHSGAQAKGTYDVDKTLTYSADQRALVWQRLTSTDPAKLMPRTSDGKAYALQPARLSQWAEVLQ